MMRLCIRSAVLLLVVVAACAHGRSSAPPHPTFQVTVSGAGRPILFVPGVGCTGEIWRSTVAHFGGRIEAHVVSIAGYGGTPPVATRPLLAQVRRELVAYLRASGLRDVVVVGHSLGGMLAIALAEDAPDLLAGVVVIDGSPAPGISEGVSQQDIEDFRARYRALRSEQELAAEMRPLIDRMITAPEDRARQLAMSARSDPATIADTVYELLTTDLRPGLSSIRIPTLVLVAGESTVPPAWTEIFAPIPSHRIETIAHSRHFVMFDQPAALEAALDRFLAAL